METGRSSRLQQVIRIVAALLAGAVVPAVVVATVYMRALAQPSTTAWDWQPSPSAFGITFVVALAFTLAHAFVLGLPLLLIGLRLRALRWWSCVLAAFVIGCVPSLWASASLMEALPMGVLGAIGGLTFWLTWRHWPQQGQVTEAAGP